MSPEQCRAARAWLGWSQQELARRAKVSLSTVQGFEKAGHRTIAATADAMQHALEATGIEFIEDGVRLSRSAIPIDRAKAATPAAEMQNPGISQAEFEKVAVMLIRKRGRPLWSHELYDEFCRL